MRHQRGSSMVEVIVAAMIAAGIALGLTIFFLASLRLGKDVDAQAALQRQGSAIAEELGRRLRVADGSPKLEDPALPPEIPSCLPLADASNDMVLVIPNADGSATCYYRDTSSPPRIVRCTRPSPDEDCDPVANLLSGSLVALSATEWSAALVTPCGAADGTCSGDPEVCSVGGQSCAAVPGARVRFTLTDGTNRPESFGVTMVATRH
jgi:hypothetical protein